MSTNSKEKLHHLVEELSEDELHTAEQFLEYLCIRSGDPLFRVLTEAPEDDEEETSEEAAAVEEAREDLVAGRVTRHEEIKREFGL